MSTWIQRREHRGAGRGHTYVTKSPKVDVRGLLAIVRAPGERALTRDELMEAADCSRSTLYRYLADLERELGVLVEQSEGMYALKNWGMLNRRRVMAAA